MLRPIGILQGAAAAPVHDWPHFPAQWRDDLHQAHDSGFRLLQSLLTENGELLHCHRHPAWTDTLHECELENPSVRIEALARLPWRYERAHLTTLLQELAHDALAGGPRRWVLPLGGPNRVNSAAELRLRIESILSIQAVQHAADYGLTLAFETDLDADAVLSVIDALPAHVGICHAVGRDPRDYQILRDTHREAPARLLQLHVRPGPLSRPLKKSLRDLEIAGYEGELVFQSALDAGLLPSPTFTATTRDLALHED